MHILDRVFQLNWMLLRPLPVKEKVLIAQFQCDLNFIRQAVCESVK